MADDISLAVQLMDRTNDRQMVGGSRSCSSMSIVVITSMVLVDSERASSQY